MSDVSTCLSLKKVFRSPVAPFYAKLNLRQPSLKDLERGVFSFQVVHTLFVQHCKFCISLPSVGILRNCILVFKNFKKAIFKTLNILNIKNKALRKYMKLFTVNLLTERDTNKQSLSTKSITHHFPHVQVSHV